MISYRRADSESVVDRIYSELMKSLRTQDVLLTMILSLGKRFLDMIRKLLAISKFALVLVGPQLCSIKGDTTLWFTNFESFNTQMSSFSMETRITSYQKYSQS